MHEPNRPPEAPEGATPAEFTRAARRRAMKDAAAAKAVVRHGHGKGVAPGMRDQSGSAVAKLPAAPVRAKIPTAPVRVRVSAAPASIAPPRPRSQKPAKGRGRGPLKSLFTLVAVTGMVATVALPAYAAWQPEEVAVTTLQQLAEGGAQTLVVASDVETSAVVRDSYAATTPEEIRKKKEEEAARLRAIAEAAAKAAAEAAAAKAAEEARANGTADQSAARYEEAAPAAVPSDVPLVAPGSGEVRRPLPYFDQFGTPYSGHKGTDYMVGRGTPIYSVAAGTVVSSTETSNGWGVMVKIAHNLGGASVTTLYAHMLYNSRLVQVGDTVSAGEMIGQVSDTGLAFGTHLHLEVVVNGSYQVPESWLAANAG